MFRRFHWLAFYVFSTVRSQNFCQIICAWAADAFERLQGITLHWRVEVVYFDSFTELVVNFQTFLGEIFEQFKFFWFAIEGGHCCCFCCYWELMLLANCWRANRNWSASVVSGVFSLRNCDRLVERAFFHFPEVVPREQQGIPSWTPVSMSEIAFLIWFRWVAGLTSREFHIEIGFNLGTTSSGFPVI